MSHQGWSFESGLDWSAIAGCRAMSYGHPVILVFGYDDANWDRRYTIRFWRIDHLPASPMIEIESRRFDVDPRALYGFVQTYVDNAALRSELGTEAALIRARRAPTATG